MDLYLISVNLKPGVRDAEFTGALAAFMESLKADGRIEGWRLLRAKLGFGLRSLGEFILFVETRDMAQLERAFQLVSSRGEPIEGAHFAVNSQVMNFQAGLYRDFPDPQRSFGEERF